MDLIAAKIVTRVVDAEDFGWSGIEEWSNEEALTGRAGQIFQPPALLCDVTVAFFTEILSLPTNRSGPILRALVEPTK